MILSGILKGYFQPPYRKGTGQSGPELLLSIVGHAGSNPAREDLTMSRKGVPMNEKARERIAEILNKHFYVRGHYGLSVAEEIISLPELSTINEPSGVLMKKECEHSGKHQCFNICNEEARCNNGYIPRELTNAEIIELFKEDIRIHQSALGYAALPSGERLELKEKE